MLMFCETTLETKAHSEKSMNVSDVQVSRMVSAGQTQHDDTRNVTIRANLDNRFPVPSGNNMIVKERIWIHPVTSKIVKQPLESDNDAQLHKECVITVRKAAEFDSRVLHKKCPR